MLLGFMSTESLLRAKTSRFHEVVFMYELDLYRNRKMMPCLTIRMLKKLQVEVVDSRGCLREGAEELIS